MLLGSPEARRPTTALTTSSCRKSTLGMSMRPRRRAWPYLQGGRDCIKISRERRAWPHLQGGRDSIKNCGERRAWPYLNNGRECLKTSISAVPI